MTRLSRDRCSAGAALFAAALCALCLPSSALGADQTLPARVERVLSAGRLRKASVGICVVRLGDGRVLYSRNADRPFIVASNEKLVTAAAALDALGPDYWFTTRIYARGELKDGVLEGDLILRGGGDPTIGGRYEDQDAEAVMGRWARMLAAKGLGRVRGDVVADDRFFDRQFRHPAWRSDQLWKWHYAPVCGVSVNDNCVEVTVRPGGRVGEAARLLLEPACAPVELKNLCRTHARRNIIWFERRPGSELIRVGGFVKLKVGGFSGLVTVPDPPRYAAVLLKAALESAGIRVEGSARAVDLARDGPVPAGPPLCVRRTALMSVLRVMLKRSDNHYAEQVLKAVGAEATGQGSWRSGTARAGRFLERVGLRPEDFTLDDGSGLSRGNRLTPAALAMLLVAMRRSELGDQFAEMLPVAGRDGTLKRRLAEPPYAGKVRAKTGYLSGVGALSGYATTRGGVEVAFSILINDSANPPGSYSMRRAVDDVCRAMLGGS